jgi:hypothetical protein
MKLIARVILGATTLALIAATPAVAGFSGNWTLEVYSGQTHSHNVNLCMVFTNTGNIDGFPDSGTWAQYESPTFGGNFIVDGNTLRWYGTAYAGAEAVNFYNHIENGVPGGGGFDDWYVSSPPITPLNDGVTRLKAGFHRCGPLHK